MLFWLAYLFNALRLYIHIWYITRVFIPQSQKMQHATLNYLPFPIRCHNRRLQSYSTINPPTTELRRRFLIVKCLQIEYRNVLRCDYDVYTVDENKESIYILINVNNLTCFIDWRCKPCK